MAVVNGTAGNDIMIGRAGADTLIGGDGSDVYLVQESVDTVLETNPNRATGGTDLVHCYLASYTLPANVENGIMYFAGSFSSMTGNALDNVITAGVLDNRIDGGSGSDTVSYELTGEGVTVRLGLSGPQRIGAAVTGSGTDTLISIENVIGGSFNDSLFGSSGANRIDGGTGGKDLLDGGAGADTMVGGNDNDLYYVRDAGDVIIESAERFAGSDTALSFLGSYTMAANVETGRIMSTGTANLTGNAGANVLVAGAGNNALDGGLGSDTVDYGRATSAITASLLTTAAQATGGSGSDSFVRVESLRGSTFGDRLTGNAVANTLSGMAGADTLNGGLGNDVLVGGAGADAFLFASAPGTTNVDRISDFSTVDDTIRIENAIFTALTTTGTLSSTQFRTGIGTVAALDADDHLLYNLSTSTLYYDPDGNGAAEAIRIAVLDDFNPSTSAPVLTAADFLIV